MKKSLLFIAGMVASTALLAQPTLTANDLNYSIGSTYPSESSDYMSPGQAGANVTWDFSSFTSNGAYIQTGEPANGSFPNSDITLANASAESYLEQGTNGLNTWGIDAGGTVITYTDPGLMIFYPLSYNATTTNTFEATFTSGVAFTRAGSETLTCDGYGTVITPTGTYTNALRVYHQQTYSDTYTGGQIDYVINVYAWYIQGYPSAIASVSESYTDGNLAGQYAQYSTDATASLLTEENNGFEIYPNPANNQIQFKSFNNTTVETIEVINSLGAVVKRVDANNSMINDITVDVNSLESGVYFVQITGTSGELIQRKFIKQ